MKHYSILLLFIFACQSNTNGVPDHIYPKSNSDIKYQKDWQKDFYVKRIKIFKENPIGSDQIILLGNSITEDANDWNDRFHSTNITNRGISGDITDGILERLDEIIYFKPLAIFLLIGINDIYAMNLPEGEQTEDYISDNIIKILDRLREEVPNTKLYLQTILPTHRDDIKDQIKRINSSIINNAQPEITVIDLHSKFADENGLMTAEYSTDGVHLNTYGYDIWSDHIRRHINKFITKRPKILEPDSTVLELDSTSVEPDTTSLF
mgnify:CR=1 FL=1